MKRETLLAWRRLLLGFTALSCCSGLDVSILQPEYEVARGGDIAMTCDYVPARPDFKFFILKWEVQPEKDNDPWRAVASYFLNSQVDIAPGFEGRAEMSVDMATQQSTLKINRVVMQDSRTFQCSVTIQGDDEGKTAATTQLLVLEPPSKPVCQIQGTAEYWNNISLTCVSEEGSPLPTYAWKSYSIQNVPRPFPPRSGEKDGTLSLVNISMETSGFFVCTSTNRIGSEHCNLTLSVLPTSMKVGATAGIVVGVLVGVIILGIVIYCCCCRKEKQDKNAQGPPEVVKFEDRPSVRDQYWDDKSSSLTKPYVEESDQFEEQSVRDESNYGGKKVAKIVLDSEQHSYNGDKDGQESSYDNRHDHPRGSSDRLDDKPDRYRGSRDRLDDRRDDVRGSRDRLDEQPDRYRGSRDRLDDQPDRYRGSRDRLDDQPDRYRGSRDRLDDRHDDVRGSRDRLDDQPDRYRGSRDRLDDRRDDTRGSRDRLDDNRDRRYGSREQLDAQYNLQGEKSHYDM